VLQDGSFTRLGSTETLKMVLCHHKDYLSEECCVSLPTSKSTLESEKEMENYLLKAIDAMFSQPNNSIYQKFLSSAERLLIKKAIEITNGNQVQAARLLGISRTTLRKKLEECPECGQI